VSADALTPQEVAEIAARWANLSHSPVIRLAGYDLDACADIAALAAHVSALTAARDEAEARATEAERSMLGFEGTLATVEASYNLAIDAWESRLLAAEQRATRNAEIACEEQAGRVRAEQRAERLAAENVAIVTELADVLRCAESDAKGTTRGALTSILNSLSSRRLASSGRPAGGETP